LPTVDAFIETECLSEIDAIAVISKVAVVLFAGTVILGGNETSVDEVVRSTRVPGGGAGVFRVTVKVADSPAFKLPVGELRSFTGIRAYAVASASEVTVIPGPPLP
jgi:hypothetical protein